MNQPKQREGRGNGGERKRKRMRSGVLEERGGEGG